MRSQLFGFVVRSHVIFELLLDCSLEQAVAVMKQLIIECGAIVPTEPLTGSKLIHFLNDPLTIGIEVILNEWEEEIALLVREVLAKHALNHEFLRMKELERALAWLWPNLRETMVLGQFIYSITIDNKVLLTVTFGWNSAASPRDIKLTDTYIPLYIRKLEKLGYQYSVRTYLFGEIEAPARPPENRPRLETLRKLQELVAHRAKHIEPNFVSIDKMQACADVNLALQTVKKYAPILYDRWYDPSYEGDVQ
jgi:hypothetical protein